MAQFDEELVDYLVTKSLATKGTDTFYSAMPDVSADPTTVIREIPGREGPRRMPHAHASIQVMVRGSTKDVARAHAANIHNLFHGMFGVSLTDNYVMTSGGPIPTHIGQDAQNRELVSANYEFTTYRLSSSGQEEEGTGGDKDPNIET